MRLTHEEANKLAAELFQDQPSGSSEAHGPRPGQALPVQIGPYRIVRLIASGGMGTVYEAWQEHPRRAVALKVMKCGIASPTALKRSLLEPELLARLHHPAIAQIYESGVHSPGDGPVPFFAMELIQHAKTITRFCRDIAMSTRDRLEIFARVCDGVHHGHQKGIIHRDLKPGNILVDDAGQPKIIDFGVARATDSDVTMATMRRDVGELVGTLQYMSPEQCACDPHEVDVRSDVYSLGVILYELLCGRLPYDLSDAPMPHAMRTLQSAEPARPGMIQRALRGDIEAIVLHALEKDPRRRYQSAADFGQDIRRFLRGEPIGAKPPTSWMRAARWGARYPIAVSTTAALAILALSVASSLATAWWLNRRPHRLELAIDGRDATLRTVSGSPMRVWRSGKDHGIAFAILMRASPTSNEDMHALLGFNRNSDPSFDRALLAFGASSSSGPPEWSDRVADSDIPTSFAAAGVQASGFEPRHIWQFDLFPGSEGSELIVAFQHGGGLCLLLVYDERGRRLASYWHHGHVFSAYWVSGPRLLVLAGLNTEAFWQDREVDPEDVSAMGRTRPYVIFGLVPQDGERTVTAIATTEAGPGYKPAWYRCVLPPRITGRLDHARTNIFEPPPDLDATRAVLVSLDFPAERGAITLLLDEHGNEDRTRREMTNELERHPQGWDWADLHLGPLPPVRAPAAQDRAPATPAMDQ